MTVTPRWLYCPHCDSWSKEDGPCWLCGVDLGDPSLTGPHLTSQHSPGSLVLSNSTPDSPALNSR